MPGRAVSCILDVKLGYKLLKWIQQLCPEFTLKIVSKETCFKWLWQEELINGGRRHYFAGICYTERRQYYLAGIRWPGRWILSKLEKLTEGMVRN